MIIYPWAIITTICLAVFGAMLLDYIDQRRNKKMAFKKKKKMEDVDSDVVESKDEESSSKEEEQVEVGFNELPAFLYAVAVHTQNTAALLMETNKKLDELIKKVGEE